MGNAPPAENEASVGTLYGCFFGFCDIPGVSRPGRAVRRTWRRARPARPAILRPIGSRRRDRETTTASGRCCPADTWRTRAQWTGGTPDSSLPPASVTQASVFLIVISRSPRLEVVDELREELLGARELVPERSPDPQVVAELIVKRARDRLAGDGHGLASVLSRSRSAVATRTT
jgi:hypothetical protein